MRVELELKRHLTTGVVSTLVAAATLLRYSATFTEPNVKR